MRRRRTGVRDETMYELALLRALRATDSVESRNATPCFGYSPTHLLPLLQPANGEQRIPRAHAIAMLAPFARSHAPASKHVAGVETGVSKARAAGARSAPRVVHRVPANCERGSNVRFRSNCSCVVFTVSTTSEATRPLPLRPRCALQLILFSPTHQCLFLLLFSFLSDGAREPRTGDRQTLQDN